MERNDELKKGKLKENIIGILMLIPLYIPMIAILNMLVDDYIGEIVVPIAMYLPAVIGLVLLYISEKDEVSTMLAICATISLIIAIFCWCMTYANDAEGWGGIGYVFGWIISSFAFRVCGAIYIGKNGGKVKCAIFSGLYLVFIVLSFLISFWA